ncbi:hypothetical protein P22_2364 [Propionispora sp. 2/2-37]|uniref:sensor histidine kinase n=1 Tax=Propionispora sp. 2/2-37 TaxID=1677858 RepID=UPI0006BB6D88|nr:ATP-binding protein [Propionispora sp. 2/2-37]CUH96274.1 hypothetical protein P22_2364 [Propionispora sp. 2/2-37]
MFQQLRFKLTLINVAVTFFLLVVLTGGTYYFMQANMNNRTEFGARKLIADIKSGKMDELLPPLPPPGPLHTIFFVKTDPGGNIIFKPDAGRMTEPEYLNVLVTQSLQAKASEGHVQAGDVEYFYMKSPLENHTGTVIVFEDMTMARNTLRGLLTALCIVGIICLALSFFSSAFMAERAMIPIQKALQQQKEFLSDASHELRTPLAVMQTNLDIVLNTPSGTVASQKRWLDNIQEEATQMTKLINSLLFLARIDSQEQQMENKAFDLASTIIQSVRSFEPLAASKGIALLVDAGPQVIVQGDEGKIKQVVCILMDNALRHTPAGGQITLRLTPKGSRTLLTVADSGEGIDPAYLDKIFDRFYQVDQSRSKGGAGLGLAIAKWIVEKHRGIIQVASTPGIGTTFTIQIPSKCS